MALDGNVNDFGRVRMIMDLMMVGVRGLTRLEAKRKVKTEE